MREPRLRERREACGFAPVDGFRGRDERTCAACLHFDERVATRVVADEVDLAETRAHVPGDDAKTLSGQLALRQMLAGKSEEAPRLYAKAIGRALRQGCVAVIRRTLSAVPLLVVMYRAPSAPKTTLRRRP